MWGNLIESVGSRVVVVEIRSLVLHQTKYRDASPGHCVDICRRGSGIDKCCSDWRKHSRDLLKGSSRGWVEYAGESEWVSGTQIAFDGPDMIRQRSFVFGHIAPAPRPAVLLIHPRNYAQRASRRQPKLFAQLRGLQYLPR